MNKKWNLFETRILHDGMSIFSNVLLSFVVNLVGFFHFFRYQRKYKSSWGALPCAFGRELLKCGKLEF